MVIIGSLLLRALVAGILASLVTWLCGRLQAPAFVTTTLGYATALLVFAITAGVITIGVNT